MITVSGIGAEACWLKAAEASRNAEWQTLHGTAEACRAAYGLARCWRRLAGAIEEIENAKEALRAAEDRLAQHTVKCER